MDNFLIPYLIHVCMEGAVSRFLEGVVELRMRPLLGWVARGMPNAPLWLMPVVVPPLDHGWH